MKIFSYIILLTTSVSIAACKAKLDSDISTLRKTPPSTQLENVTETSASDENETSTSNINDKISTDTETVFSTNSPTNNKTTIPTIGFSLTNIVVNKSQGSYKTLWHDGYYDWKKRIFLRFINGTRSSNLVNFIALVTLTSTNIDYNDIDVNGKDIRFVDNDGQDLDYEIDTWNYGGRSSIWVKIPNIDSLSNDDGIWLYFSNTQAPAKSSSEVWNTKYRSVWHFNEDPVGISSVLDSSGNNNHASPVNTPTREINGLIGSAFRTADNHLSVNNSTSLDLRNASYSIEMWINADDLTSNKQIFGIYTVNNYGKELKISQSISDIGFHIRGTITTLSSGNASIEANKWHQIVVTFDIGTSIMKLFVDGVLASSIVANYVFTGDTPQIYIGNAYLGQDYYSFRGMIDELRLTYDALSEDEINASYACVRMQCIAFEEIESFEQSQYQFIASLSHAMETETRIPYTVEEVGTLAGQHNLIDGTLTFAAGEQSKPININLTKKNISDDAVVKIKLANTTNAIIDPTTDEATIKITNNVNLPPAANDDTFSVSLHEFVELDVLANDTDSEGGPLVLSPNTNPSNGSVFYLGNKVLYKANNVYNVSDSFSYTVTDEFGLQDTATVTINPLWTNYKLWLGSIDSSWSNPLNWLGDSLPSPSDIVVFQGDSCAGGTCNVSVDQSIDIQGMWIIQGYNGIITQAASQSIAIGKSGYIQAGGTFIGSSSGTVTISYSKLKIITGNYTAANDTTLNFSHFDIANATSYAHNNGTVTTYSAIDSSALPIYNVAVGSHTLYNYNIEGAGAQVAISGSLSIENNFRMDGNSSTASPFQTIIGSPNLIVYKDLYLDAYGAIGQIDLTLAGSQSGMIKYGGTIPFQPFSKITINKTSGAGMTIDALSQKVKFMANTPTVEFLSGFIDMNGIDMELSGQLVLPVGTSITKNGGTLTYGSITPTLGSGGDIFP